MNLVDTNIWLERLLDQPHSAEVGEFLDRTSSEQLFITDFSFHSIGVIMHRLERAEGFLRFVQDAFLDGAITVVRLEADDMQPLLRMARQFKLDFDDAYQYAAAEKYDLTLVSFDTDFDGTDRGRKSPSQV